MIDRLVNEVEQYDFEVSGIDYNLELSGSGNEHILFSVVAFSSS